MLCTEIVSDIQKTCLPHVLQKEELLTKIYPSDKDLPVKNLRVHSGKLFKNSVLSLVAIANTFECKRDHRRNYFGDQKCLPKLSIPMEKICRKLQNDLQ